MKHIFPRMGKDSMFRKRMHALSFFLFLIIATTSQGQKINSDTSYRERLRSDNTINQFSLDEKRQTPDYIIFKEDKGYSLQEAGKIFQNYFPFRTGLDEMVLKNSTKTNDNIETIRYQQYFKGIKVEHGNITVTARNSKTSFVMGEYYALNADTRITGDIDETVAFSKATQFVGAQQYNWEEAGSGPRPAGELVFVTDYRGNKGLRLAYKYDIYAISPLSRAYIYIDANDGTVLLEDRIIKHLNPDLTDNAVNSSVAPIDKNEQALQPAEKLFANASGSAETRYSGTQTIITDNTGPSFRLYQTRNADPISVKNYQKRNQSTGNNALAVEFTDLDNNWTAAEYNNANYDNAALDVQFAMQFISDYWQGVHTRNSWDNTGGAMNSYVHVRATGSSTLDYDNAFWNGSAMFYGDGTYLSGNTGGFLPLTSLDVSAHELGHAVCQSTANLVYQKESGAMNEGFSDIWGASIENYAALGAPKNPWLIGEEIYPSQTALRSMSDPKSQGQPDTYLGTNWVDASAACTPSSGNDYCGVHTNSGVLNHWFYILVVGKTGFNDLGNGYSVTGIGWTNAEKIAYATELALTTGSTYANARTASIAASTTLFGACSPQTISVTNAWYAVGVGTQFVPCGVEVYYKTPAINISETATPAGCPPSTKVITTTITLSAASTQQTDATLTVTVAGSASSGQDFSVTPQTVTWAAGTSGDKTFSITINDDNNIEGTETIVLGLTVNNYTGTAIAGSFNQTSTISILDDESAPSTNILTDIIGVGTFSLSGSTTPFQGLTFTKKRSQFLYTAAEISAAGFTKGYISQLGFYFYNNASSATFNNFNLKIGTTAATKLNSGFVAYSGPVTTFYSGNLNTPVGTTILSFNMATPSFYWDGLTNVIVETCYDNAAATTANILILGDDKGITNYHGTYVGSTTANVCGDPATNLSQYQPVLYLKMVDAVQSTVNLSKTAYLGPNADVAFFSATDGKIMARIKNNSAWDYGCTQVVVDRAGTGSSQFWNATTGNYLTNKTFRVIPTNNKADGNYDITLFYTKAEHDGWEAATTKDWESVAKITKVSGHDINEVTPSTTSYFPSVNVALSNTRALFGTDYQITATFLTGFSGFGVGDPGISTLPVQLLSFTGTKGNRKSLLNWLTGSEQNNDRFEIETSKNGIDFYSIGIVKSKGNSTSNQQYAFTDNLPAAGANFYRLRQVDLDGQTKFSNIVLLSFDGNGTRDISIYPNPASNKLSFAVSKPASQVLLRIYSMDGRQVYTETVSSIIRSFEIPVEKLAPGSYILESIIDQEKKRIKFIKQ